MQGIRVREDENELMERYKKHFKENIQLLIEQGLLQDAKDMVGEYEKIVKDEVDIYSIKGVISMIEGEMDEAEMVLKKGLDIQPFNCDILYNLAYLYETQEKYIAAYRSYEKIGKVADGEMITEVSRKIEELEKLEDVKEYKRDRDKVEDTEKIPVITITTWAYNAEKYIEACIESVLSQSFTNFEWVILDNGSTDNTSDILKKYENSDKRIIVFRNEKNSIIYNSPHNPEYLSYVRNLKSEYRCVLDSDDYLHVDFLKELYNAAKKHNADIAVAGSEMLKEENCDIRGTRCPPNFFTKDITYIGDIFPQIYGCFRPLWGKLFKVSVMGKQLTYRLNNPIKVSNGEDTIVCLYCLKFANSVVGINKALHYYRIREKSFYHSHVDKNRYHDYKTIYNESKKLLESWNKLNDINLNYIANILYYSMIDCMNIAASAVSVPIEDRLEVIETIISDEFVYEVLRKADLLNNLLVDTQNIVNHIIENITEDDSIIATNHYVYRLYKSIKIANDSKGNKQNAFLLYISSLYDENNKNHFGSVFLFSFFSLIGKHDLAELKDYRIESEFLASDPQLFRDIVNNNFDSVNEICEENSEFIGYDLLKIELHRVSGQVDFKWLRSAKDLIETYISEENFYEAENLILRILDYCPLDKEALCYRLYLLTLNGDMLTALEIAEVLVNFYFEDSTSLISAAQTFAWANLKDKASETLHKAIDMCTDETRLIEIKRELKAVQ